ncbi:hypothetical protein BD770DRAFT_404290 [Pilaira anomala]|nr:hypothetical protein BD770DRAFT_404290 [Pilaira anomala]
MSVGDQLSHMLSNDDTRKSLQYRHEREEVPGVISDYFDGEDYKTLKAMGMFESPDDIALALFVDGFVNQKKYTDNYMFQLAILPGKVKDLDSFLLPIVDEIKSLGEHGLIVKNYDGETIKAKVHLVMATGDIPQEKKKGHVN